MSETPQRELRRVVLDAILEIAPDLESEDLASGADLHDDLGLDSIDLVNVAGEIAARTGIEIPETAASAVRTVEDLVSAIVTRAGGAS